MQQENMKGVGKSFMKLNYGMRQGRGFIKMKPRIRKKDKDKKGNSRYILEWEEDGKIRNHALNPHKLLDYLQKSKIIKKKQQKDGL